MTVIKFLPAFARSFWRHSTFNRGIQLPFDPRRAGTPLYRPDVLLSYHYWRMEPTLGDWRDRGYVFGDSGGFSIRTLGASKLDPVAVMRWQEQVCSSGCILDMPADDKQKGRVWDKALQTTLANVSCVVPLYEGFRKAGTPFRWWGVLHGAFGAEVEHWHRQVADIYPFTAEGEGWATGPEPRKDPATVALMLRFLHSKKVKRLHLLGSANPGTMAVLYAFGPEAGFEFISYDAANAVHSGRNRSIYIPTMDGMSWTYLKEKSREEGDVAWLMRRYMWDKCECGYCAELRACQPTIEGVPDFFWSTYSILHNWLLLFETFERYLAAVAQQGGDALLRTVLSKADYRDALRAYHAGVLPTQTPSGSAFGLLGGAGGQRYLKEKEPPPPPPYAGPNLFDLAGAKKARVK